MYQFIEYEYKIVKIVFEGVLVVSKLDDFNICYYIFFVVIFNGDLLLVVYSLFGGFYILMVDFIGYGLLVVIGVVLFLQVFFDVIE